MSFVVCVCVSSDDGKGLTGSESSIRSVFSSLILCNLLLERDRGVGSEHRLRFVPLRWTSLPISSPPFPCRRRLFVSQSRRPISSTVPCPFIYICLLYTVQKEKKKIYIYIYLNFQTKKKVKNGMESNPELERALDRFRASLGRPNKRVESQVE